MTNATKIETIRAKAYDDRFAAIFMDNTTNTIPAFIGPNQDVVEDAAQADYRKRLNAGHSVSANGKRQCILWEEIVDENHNPCNYRGKAGEERVEGNRILVTMHNATKEDRSKRYKTREVLGTSWRKADWDD